MPGGGGQSTNTVTKADPWAGVQPSLLSLYGKANDLVNGGVPAYYPGQTVADRSNVTEAGRNAIGALVGTEGSILNPAIQNVQATTGGDYLYSQPGMAGLNDIGNTDFASNTPTMQQLAALGASDASRMPASNDLYGFGTNDYAAGSKPIQQLGGMGNYSALSMPGVADMIRTAMGGYLNSNPYVDSMFGQASRGVGRQFANNVMPGVASMYSAAGRYGSGAMGEGLGQAQQQYGQTLNDLATQIYGGNYANERQLQQGAQTTLGNFGLGANSQNIQALTNAGQMGLQSRGLQQSALQDVIQAALQGRQLQQNALSSFNQSQLEGRGQQISALQAAGNLFGNERNRMMQASQLAPALDQSRFFGAGQLLNLGAQDEARQQQLLDAAKAKYDFTQQAPYNQLSWLSNVLQGAPMGSSSSSNTSGGSNGLLNLLGGANLASGIARNMGLFGTAMSAPLINGAGALGVGEALPGLAEAASSLGGLALF